MKRNSVREFGGRPGLLGYDHAVIGAAGRSNPTTRNMPT